MRFTIDFWFGFALLVAAISVATVCTGCDISPEVPAADAGLTWRPVGASDASPPTSLCDTIPVEMVSCAGCHVEAETIAGFNSRPAGSRLSSQTWGRSAFFVLFTRSNVAAVPSHSAPYQWAETCFCQGGSSRNAERRCSTLSGEF